MLALAGWATEAAGLALPQPTPEVIETNSASASTGRRGSTSIVPPNLR